MLLIVLYFGLYQFVGVFGAGTLVDFLEKQIFVGAGSKAWPAMRQGGSIELGMWQTPAAFRFATTADATLGSANAGLFFRRNPITAASMSSSLSSR